MSALIREASYMNHYFAPTNPLWISNIFHLKWTVLTTNRLFTKTWDSQVFSHVLLTQKCIN
jgi:hypothetical protein